MSSTADTPSPTKTAREDRLYITRRRNRDKQRRYLARQKELGIVMVSGLAPQRHAADLRDIMQMLIDHPNLRPALRDADGKVVSLRRRVLPILD